ncbi:MAG TPA: methyltransferase domain-containing protein [Gemmatimonadaceae bacterium]|nr:methyltransferase domain-containing protein [Gemmatimonadaceae bacterium]
MSPLLDGGRQRGVEFLDDPAVAPEVITRSMRDVARANTLFGGKRAALAELRPAIEGLRETGSLLDVGTGLGDIPAAAKRLAGTLRLSLWTIGMDCSPPLIAIERRALDAVVRADALCLPFADRSVDIVMASQVLHHFPNESAVSLIREMNRVARTRVVIADLRRSRIAAVGLWLGSFPLGFHPVSRHDGVVSVMRGFQPVELTEIVEVATGRRPVVQRRLGFRLTTSWNPDP